MIPRALQPLGWEQRASRGNLLKGIKAGWRALNAKPEEEMSPTHHKAQVSGARKQEGSQEVQGAAGPLECPALTTSRWVSLLKQRQGCGLRYHTEHRGPVLLILMGRLTAPGLPGPDRGDEKRLLQTVWPLPRRKDPRLEHRGLPTQWGKPDSGTPRPTISLPGTPLNVDSTAGPRHLSKALSPKDEGQAQWVRHNPTSLACLGLCLATAGATTGAQARQAPRPGTACTQHLQARAQASMEGMGTDWKLFPSPLPPLGPSGESQYGPWAPLSCPGSQPPGDLPQGPPFPSPLPP